ERKGDSAGALADLDRAIGLQQPIAALYARRGAYYDQHGDLDRALADYQRAAELDSTLEWIQTKLGLLYAKRGDLAAADGSLSRASALPCREAAAEGRGAGVRLTTARYAEALPDTQPALLFAPTSAPAFLTQARLYHAPAKLADANAAASRSIELDGTHAPAY